MITVGIRNLRNSLSRYLDMVKNGSKILITDHNKIIAEIIPPETNRPESELLQKYVLEQAEKGTMVRATRHEYLAKKSGKQSTDIDDIYNETRSER